MNCLIIKLNNIQEVLCTKFIEKNNARVDQKSEYNIKYCKYEGEGQSIH